MADWARAHRRRAVAIVLVWALINGTLVKLQPTESILATTVLGWPASARWSSSARW